MVNYIGGGEVRTFFSQCLWPLTEWKGPSIYCVAQIDSIISRNEVIIQLKAFRTFFYLYHSSVYINIDQYQVPSVVWRYVFFFVFCIRWFFFYSSIHIHPEAKWFLLLLDVATNTSSIYWREATTNQRQRRRETLISFPSRKWFPSHFSRFH